MERVLARHAHRAVGLVRVAGRRRSRPGRRGAWPRRSRTAPGPTRRHAPRRRARPTRSRDSWAPWTRCAWTAWNVPTGLPNWRRAAVYSSVIASRRSSAPAIDAVRASAPRRCSASASTPGAAGAHRARHDAVEDERVARFAGEVHRRLDARVGRIDLHHDRTVVGVEQRHDLLDGPRPGHAVRGAVEHAVARVRGRRAACPAPPSPRRRAARARRPRAASRRASRSRPAGAAPRGARRSAGSRSRRPACRRTRPPPRGPTPRPGRCRRPPPRWRAPSRRPRPAPPPRTSTCRRTRGSAVSDRSGSGAELTTAVPSRRPNAGSRSCRRGW